MSTYNHMYTLAFEVPGSLSEEGEDIGPDQFRKALIKRISNLDINDEWSDAIGGPEDTYKED